ncbi:hypothetical protein SAMN06893096_103448 [Geodermatophilus pulveris]|uniref:SH3 domain-containing protein n=1 Tax=Geodermatophilus pulveris TaxID=1564159 RepID=A0A239E0G6_9ACTN|nr:hypothetical protein [Geodermatophilus pulveris]SNS37768.1 hypothetical protein SAMN06893096_103448 [Geodermatophilus pulveris]
MDRTKLTALGGAVAVLSTAGAVVLGVGGSGAANATAQPTVQTHGASLIVRDRPGRGGEEVGRLQDGQPVRIECQTEGDMVSDGYFAPTSLWDRIGPNRYVSDAYVHTGRNGRVAPECDGPRTGAATPEAPPSPAGPGPDRWLLHDATNDYRGTPYEEALRDSRQANWLGAPTNIRRNTASLPIPDVSVGVGPISAPVPRGTVSINAYGTGLHVTGVQAGFEGVTVSCNWRIDFRFTPLDPAQGVEETDVGSSRGCSRTGDRVMKYERDLPAGRLCADLVVENDFVEAACVSLAL